MNEYLRYFQKIAGNGRSALGYQETFHECDSFLRIVSVPTGLGKTLGVFIDWMFRVETAPQITPKRLIWCLPGRALTEQIADELQQAVGRSDLKIQVLSLMGGSEDNDLTLRPDEFAVLVGTQDILLSRALNRGYARRPSRWPIDFALLNNDCYWVFDEVQLLGDGLATSSQLVAFRERFGVFNPVPCTWLSATFRPEWLDTVDFAPMRRAVTVITAEGDENEIVQRRLHASKALAIGPAPCSTAAACAEFVVSKHKPGTLSLVIANTVARAREIFREVEKRSPAEPMLLHSRFRPDDRRTSALRLREALPDAGRIVVSTQVIEAGIDIDASLLVTDLAPYSSLIQRFGRANRYGDREDTEIWVVDLVAGLAEDSKEFSKACLPYEPADIVSARATIAGLNSAAPSDLPAIEQRAPWKNVLRRADLLDLFDTTPDLAGNEIDISRFVRDGDDQNTYVAWREWKQTEQDAAPPDYKVTDPELCPVPIGELKTFLQRNAAWKWKLTSNKRSDGDWVRQDKDQLYPGLVLVVNSSSGGYTAKDGWAPESKKPVAPIEVRQEPEEESSADRASWKTYRQSLREHSDRVCEQMELLLASLPSVAPFATMLRRAARHHDWGKAHPVMQMTLHRLENLPVDSADLEILAKQIRGDAWPKHSVPFFRHELASALAMLAEGESDLAAFVVAAHHGKVRMGIRSMPGERDEGGEITRGVRHGDTLMQCDLGDGERRPAVRLELSYMRLGGGELLASWSERMSALLAEHGPFRLAYLEMLLRAADERASAAEVALCQ